MADARHGLGEHISPAPHHQVGDDRATRRRLIVIGAVAAAVLLAVLVAGGYGLGWRWTGLSSSVTLWDWLEVIALPVTVGVAPLLLRHRRHLSRQHRVALATALVTFGVLVSTGYLVPLSWTGFTGNTLWDWLELALLPLVIATTSLWAGRAGVHRRHPLASGVLAACFVALVTCGYLVPWTWTGFRGNTAWDWLHLLLLPLLVPTLLMPALTERVMKRIAPPTDDPRE